MVVARERERGRRFNFHYSFESFEIYTMGFFYIFKIIFTYICVYFIYRYF